MYLSLTTIKYFLYVSYSMHHYICDFNAHWPYFALYFGNNDNGDKSHLLFKIGAGIICWVEYFYVSLFRLMMRYSTNQ